MRLTNGNEVEYNTDIGSCEHCETSTKARVWLPSDDPYCGVILCSACLSHFAAEVAEKE